MVPLASYFLENFELIALSGFQRRPCYQVLQELFIFPPTRPPSYRYARFRLGESFIVLLLMID
jgi:hypothetical protein